MLSTVPCEGARGLGIVVAATLGCVPDVAVMELESSSGAPSQYPCEGAACDCPVVFADVDGDGHGDPAHGWHVCTEPPPGTVANADDCYDANADARPGATTYQLIDRGDGSYDFDCDGMELVQFGHTAECQPWPICSPEVIDGRGWVGRIPNCGDAGDWMSDCDYVPIGIRCRKEVTRGAVAACR